MSQARVQRLKETFQTWNLADAPQVSALIQHERRVYGREEQQKEQQQQQENGDDNEKQAVVEVVAGGETSTSEIESEQRRYTVKKKEEDKQELDVCSTAETYAYALPHSAVLSLHHQESINRIRGHHRRNIPTSLSYRKKEMLKRYIVEEEDAVSLSRELDCPPCELLRGFVNDIIEKIFTNIHASERTIASSSSSSLNDTVPTDSESGVREPESLSAKLKRESKLVQAGSKKSVSKVMREPTLLLDILSILEDDPRYDDSEKALGQYEIFLVNTSVKIPFAHIFPRLVEDIIYHTCQDAMHSSLLDETRREVGDEFEENLAYCLESAGISFAREDELRRKGQAKTPDFQLHVPIFISDKCIHWIERYTFNSLLSLSSLSMMMMNLVFHF